MEILIDFWKLLQADKILPINLDELFIGIKDITRVISSGWKFLNISHRLRVTFGNVKEILTLIVITNL